MEEPGIPRPIADAVARFSAQIARFFPTGALRMGGGTILQARWRHRRSFDADLFCDPVIYVRTVAQHGPEIERAIGAVADLNEETRPFVDQIASFSCVDGTEVTILPAVALVGTKTGNFVPNTDIETESTADILAGKLVHRMCGAGVIEPRDLFDLVAAERHDPTALREAVSLLSNTQRAEISATLAMLPKRWVSFSDQPLLSIDGEKLNIDALVVKDLLHRFGRKQSSRESPKP